MKMLSLCSFLVFCLLLFSAQAGHAEPQTDVLAAVSCLNVGYDEYIIGRELTADQRDTARKNAVEESYQGTYKFKDGDIAVVVDKKSDMVLAIYRQFGRVSAAPLKDAVGGMMLRFGEPTVIAHEKTLYWLYDNKGKMSEDAFEESKKSGELNPILTVKLNSSEELGLVSSGKKEDADLYFLISSEPVLKVFMALD